MMNITGQKEIYFVGMVAVGNRIIHGDLYAKSIALRNAVYERHNWRKPGDPETDLYDRYSIQFVIAQSGRVLQACRLVAGDQTHPIPLEEHFGDVPLSPKRAEVSRLAGSMEGTPLRDRLSLNRLLHAKMCLIVLERNMAVYALVEHPLERLLKRSGVALDKISEERNLKDYDHTINFVAKLRAEETLANMERGLGQTVTGGCDWYSFAENNKIMAVKDVERG